MEKKVIFDGIEILTKEDDSSALSLLGFVESVINSLESGLDHADENFRLTINIDFSPNHSTKHSFTVTNLSNNGTRAKVMKILDKSTNSPKNKITGTVKIDLLVKAVN